MSEQNLPTEEKTVRLTIGTHQTKVILNLGAAVNQVELTAEQAEQLARKLRTAAKQVKIKVNRKKK